MSYKDGSPYIHLGLRFIADLSLFVSLLHSPGPRYRIECFPYVTVLNLGKCKSLCRKLYLCSLYFSAVYISNHKENR